MDLIEINEYCALIEKWYKDTYNVEYNEYEAEDNYAAIHTEFKEKLILPYAI